MARVGLEFRQALGLGQQPGPGKDGLFAVVLGHPAQRAYETHQGVALEVRAIFRRVCGLLQGLQSLVARRYERDSLFADLQHRGPALY